MVGFHFTLKGMFKEGNKTKFQTMKENLTCVVDFIFDTMAEDVCERGRWLCLFSLERVVVRFLTAFLAPGPLFSSDSLSGPPRLDVLK